MRRRSIFCFIAATMGLAVLALPHPILAAETIENAEPFIRSLTDQAIATLSDQSLDASARRENMIRMLDESFALDSIGRWVLGRYRSRATAEQEAEYLRLFRLSVIAFMTTTLRKYSGENMIFTGSLEDGPGGTMVVSRIKQTGGRPFEIIWRIQQTDSGLKIVDVLAGGLSLAKTRRDDYASTIRRVGGDMDAFLEILRGKLEPANDASVSSSGG